MKKATLLLFFLALLPPLWGQKMPIDYFDEGLAFTKVKKFEEALSAFQYIVEHHPKNELYPKAFYNIGHTYLQLRDEERAKVVFKAILESEFDEKEQIGGSIMASPYANFRHRAADILSYIYVHSGDYDSTLHYLVLSDAVYPYFHTCGADYNRREKELTARYESAYQLFDNPDDLKNALLQAVFLDLKGTSKVVTKLKGLYEEDDDKYLLIKELDTALESIYDKPRSQNKTSYIQYYFNFQGTEITIPFEFYKEHAFNKTATISKLKRTGFYRMIANL